MSAGRKICAIPAGAEDDFSGSDDDDGFFCSNNRATTTTALPRPPGVDPNAVGSGGAGDGRQSLDSQNSNMNSYSSASPRYPVGNALQKRSKDQDVEDFKSALSANQIEVAKRLLTENLDPNATSRSGWSPLMFAVDYGQVEICKTLLSLGANPRHHIDSFTVLMQACKCRAHDGPALELVKLLVEEYKVDAQTKDRYHSTPLMYAVMDGHKDVVEYLIESCKLDVNVFDARGHTALMLAVKNGHNDVVEALLQRGADKDKMNIDGKTAPEMALDGGNVKIINLLHDKSKSSQFSLFDSYSGITRYGEMENFFCGLQLNELVDLFREQKLEFKQLLLLSEDDLFKMGVKMGDVKTVAEAIHALHKHPWNKTSLHKFDPKTKNVLKCSEAVAMVSNVGKHVSLICSTIGYTTDQVKLHSSVLESGIDNQAVLQLQRLTREALSNVRALQNELVVLDGILNDSQTVASCLPVDLIDRNVHRKVSRRSSPNLISVTLGVSLVTAVAAVIYTKFRT